MILYSYMMTGIIPCLYNSFSFTNENIVGGNITCYEIKSARMKQYDQEYSSEKALNTSISTVPAMPVVPTAPVVLPEPLYLKKSVDDYDTEANNVRTDSESDSIIVDDTDTDSDTDSESSKDSSVVGCAIKPLPQFHPDDMKQYAYRSKKSNESANTDSILWSLYIMLYGSEKYETVENHYVESNRFKFELIDVFRQNKPILKANKIKLSSVEESLVHKPFITLETLHAVAVCKSLSLCIVQDRKFYEVECGGGSGSGSGSVGPFIIEKIKGQFVLYIAPQKLITDYITYIRANYWRMENISAPIRPISAYKLQDLIDISQKLNLPVVNVIPGKFGSMGTEKRKTKPELYEAICRCV